ncbi:phosphotransferase enzyme family protein [Mucilaginibacter sp.]|uniref:phosphotransferase enzyme family protein n=1 Tax=Mucilaginibacter sp. TaxID=1882438 RepID=UPI003D0FB9E1
MLDRILSRFGLTPAKYNIQPFGSGLINYTLRVFGNGEDYILQKINSNVFKSPDDIAKNLALIQAYLKQTNPGYFFVGALPSTTGDFLIKSKTDEFYRLFPFVKGSKTIDFISEPKEAFEAARQFGKFTYMLKDFEAAKLHYTLADFHNLKLRFEQFKAACQNASQTRLNDAAAEIKEVYNHYDILQTYNELMDNNQLPVRVIHHDTKISNVLFDAAQNGLCVIDLDTIMPGYFLSDVGDMMRTYLSPANEEESDLSKVQIRENIFSAICNGYLSEMGSILNETEKQHFIFSGKFMIYMQAIRFLTDFLNGDIYYEVKYPEHNLTRAKNQFRLLNGYLDAETKLGQLFNQALSNVLSVSGN